ncbi:MAG TPA: hypothetical protein VF591_11575 [Pyrinomonadaceae bacterium]|jgi:hypothetical protein
MRNATRNISCALLALWLCGGAAASGQTPAATAAPEASTSQRADCDVVNRELGLTDNFIEVTDTRDSITSEVARLDQKVIQLNAQIPKAPTAAQLDARRQERAELEAKPKKTDDDKFRIAELDDTDVKSREELREELRATEAQLQAKKGQARCVQQAINAIYSPEQIFKRTMSIIFAILIGLVIIGFFILSYADESVRRAIFSGQTGIQFLTLFSIVIAIILFGITSILGDKELSALLGGLSGYILGRYNNPGHAGAPAGAGGGAADPEAAAA